jgi:hypothetical protein
MVNVLACAALALPRRACPADLPVRTVILYKHGVGFFEREGHVGPGESARLDFNASDMNDVLKSLTLRIAAAGRSPGCATIPWTR